MIKNIKNKSDIVFILDNLRDEDKEELYALFGDKWKEITLSDLENHEVLCLYLLNGKNEEIPIAMGGFFEQFTQNTSIACVWLLSTVFLKGNKTLFIKDIKRELEKASKKYSIMYNYIYKSNFEAKKWLKIFGFKFDKPYPKNLEIKDGFEFFYKTN